jgi:hypothetical protein
MGLFISLRSELLKTKRSPVLLLTLAMATFAPLFLLIVFKQEHDGNPSDVIPSMKKDAWNYYFYQGRGMISFVFLPMFIVLSSTLLSQIEYRNHTWKQVLAAPQSYGRVYLSKFLVLHLFILIYMAAHNLLMGGSALISNILNPEFDFSANHLNWLELFKTMAKTYIAVLALSTFQFWLSMRFKSFLVPIGIGVLLSILGMVNLLGYDVFNPDKYFFSYAAFIFLKDNVAKVPYVLWSSVICAFVFLLIGFFDFSRTKSR